MVPNICGSSLCNVLQVDPCAWFCVQIFILLLFCVYLGVNCICTQHRSVLLNFCMPLFMMMCMPSLSTQKKNRNVYVGVPGIHNYAINILWTLCVVHSQLSRVVMLHSCVWEVPGLNLGTNFPGWSLLYSCCHSRQIPVLYFQLGQDSFFQFISHCHAFIWYYVTRVTMSFNKLQAQKRILMVTALY